MPSVERRLKTVLFERPIMRASSEREAPAPFSPARASRVPMAATTAGPR